ncbi:unnamed protein product [Clonostachys byssicola]|uniref:Xylanolytic transcriptional activator regulatory domain-containing protein n=1 Tax=Clonostachys byssicola TaxID=160290 RepID=A0A9N9UNG0_9HYPO|nr:unnamed protein product [Clonostachys byssicola]
MDNTSSQRGPTSRLAHWAAAVPRERTLAARVEAQRGIKDLMGYLIGGAIERAPKTVAKVATSTSGQGLCTIVDQTQKVPAQAAAYANGTAAHILDFDDSFRPLTGHPSCTIVPAILAVAEERGSSGDDVLDAYVVGIEIAACLGRAAPKHHDCGWHGTATVGVISSAVACARLMKLDAAGITNAISMAFSASSGGRIQIGYDIKSMQPGAAARDAVMAATMAAAGIVGCSEVLTGPWGWSKVYSNVDGDGSEYTMPDLAVGEPLAIQDPGITYKPYPTCGSTHRTLNAVLELDKRRPVSKAYVAALEDRLAWLEKKLAEKDRERCADDAHVVAGSSDVSSLQVEEDQSPLPSDASDTIHRQSSCEPAERLQIDNETGEIREYGPTSMFKHLPAAPASPTCMEKSSLGPYCASTSTQYSFALGTLDEFSCGEALRLFFAFFNPWCMWVDEARFRQDMDRDGGRQGTIANRHTRTAFYSPMLHLSMLAIGFMYLEKLSYAEKIAISDSLAQAVAQFFQEEVEAARLSAVIGLMLLGSHHAGHARQSLGYIYSGTGLRLSRIQKGLIAAEMKRSRDRVWHCAYIQDKLWSTYVGRAPAPSLRHYRMPFPDVSEEEDAVGWIGHNREGQDVIVPSWQSSTTVWTSKLARVIELLLENVVLLEKWYAELPEPLRMTPSMLRGDVSDVSLLPHIAELFDERFGLSCVPISSTQFIFTAGTIHLRSVARSKNPESKLEAVSKCITALYGMGQTWKCAALSGDALQRLLEDWQAKSAKSATHGQRTRMPSEGIGNSPTSIQSVDIQHILRKDPDVAAQLRRLGWMPPEEVHVSLQGFHNPDFETLLTGMDSQNTLGMGINGGTRSDLLITDGSMADMSWMAQGPGWMYFPSTDGLPQFQHSLFDMVQSSDRPVPESWASESPMRTDTSAGCPQGWNEAMHTAQNI